MLPKEECEILMNDLLPIGVDFLKKYGEFYPYGAVLSKDDTIELLGFYEGNEFPPSKDIIDGLIETCKQLAENGEIKASGIAWNTSVTSNDGSETDSIIISLEHKDNYSVKVGLPYKIGLFKKVKLGNLFALEGDKNIF
jgi:hypothetical protein